jgi:hypothetical protein
MAVVSSYREGVLLSQATSETLALVVASYPHEMDEAHCWDRRC